MKSHSTVIIGAGPTGLSLAYHLNEDPLILEKEDRVGGLCREIQHGETVFDIGGHSFHTPYPDVYELVDRLLEGGLYQQKREAFVHVRGALINYPFQKYFNQIDDLKMVKECESGLADAAGNAELAADFQEYIERKFGRGISKHFMSPYNKKLWARDLETISCEWTSERIADTGKHEDSFDTTGGKRTPLQSDTSVAYPKYGSFGKIYESLARHIKGIKLGSEVEHIDPLRRVLTTRDGLKIKWDRLVSTMPIPELVNIVEECPPSIMREASKLQFMSLRVALLEVRKRMDTRIQRIYAADEDVIAHKIAINNNSSDFLRRQERHTVIAEASYSDKKRIDVENIGSNTIDFLSALNVLGSRNDISWEGSVDVKYAYPVYTHDRLAIVEGIKNYLESHDIYTAGRFGDWEYINSDKCIRKGMELAARFNE